MPAADPILAALKAAQHALNELPRRKLNGAQKDTYEVASLVDAAVEARERERTLMAQVVASPRPQSAEEFPAADGSVFFVDEAKMGFRVMQRRPDGVETQATEYHYAERTDAVGQAKAKADAAILGTEAVQSYGFTAALIADEINGRKIVPLHPKVTARLASQWAQEFETANAGVEWGMWDAREEGSFEQVFGDFVSAKYEAWLAQTPANQKFERGSAPAPNRQEVQFSFGEAVADLAGDFALAPEWPANSRDRASLCVEWAQKFEKDNAGVEWGVSDDREYIEEIEKFFQQQYAEWKEQTPASERIVNDAVMPPAAVADLRSGVMRALAKLQYESIVAEDAAEVILTEIAVTALKTPEATLPKADPVPTPFEVKVYDRDSAAAYLCALANSPYHYHIDDDPADVEWDRPVTREQIAALKANTAAAFEHLGNGLAWSIYYGASVAAGNMALRDADEEIAAAKKDTDDHTAFAEYAQHVARVTWERAAKTTPADGIYAATLKAVGNPDIQQFYGEGVIAPTRTVYASSPEVLARYLTAYCAVHGLGASNLPRIHVVTGSKRPVAQISFNGRLWNPKDEMKPYAGLGAPLSDLHEAAAAGMLGHPEVAARLNEHSLALKNDAGRTVAHVAAQTGHYFQLPKELRNGSTLRLTSDGGSTVAHELARFGWLWQVDRGDMTPALMDLPDGLMRTVAQEAKAEGWDGQIPPTLWPQIVMEPHRNRQVADDASPVRKKR